MIRRGPVWCTWRAVRRLSSGSPAAAAPPMHAAPAPRISIEEYKDAAVLRSQLSHIKSLGLNPTAAYLNKYLEACVAPNHEPIAATVWSMFSEFAVAPDSESYTSLCRIVSQSNQPPFVKLDRMKRIYDEIVARKLQVPPHLLDLMANIAMNSKNANAFREIWTYYDANGLQPSAKMYHFLKAFQCPPELLRQNSERQFLEFFSRKFSERSIPPSTSLLNCLISQCAATGEIDVAFQAWSLFPYFQLKRNHLSFENIMSCVAKIENPFKAETLAASFLKDLLSQKLKPSQLFVENLFSMSINSSGKLLKPFQVWKLFDEFKIPRRLGHFEDFSTYLVENNAVIPAAVAFNEAEIMYTQSLAFEIVSPAFLSNLFRISAAAQQYDFAVTIWKRFDSLGLEIPKPLYGSMLDLLATYSQCHPEKSVTKESLRILDIMKTRDVIVTQKHLHSVLAVSAASGDLDSLLAAWELFPQHKLSPGKASFSTMTWFFTRVDTPSSRDIRISQLFTFFEKIALLKLSPPREFLSEMMTFVRDSKRVEQLEEVWTWYDKFSVDRFPKDFLTYLLSLTFLFDKKNLHLLHSKAKGLWTQYKQEINMSSKLDINSQAIVAIRRSFVAEMFKISCKTTDRPFAFELWRELKGFKDHKTTTRFLTLAEFLESTYSEDNDEETVRMIDEILQEIDTFSLIVSSNCISKFYAIALRAQKLELSRRIWNLFKSKNIPINEEAITLRLDYLKQNPDSFHSQEALELFDSMKPSSPFSSVKDQKLKVLSSLLQFSIQKKDSALTSKLWGYFDVYKVPRSPDDFCKYVAFISETAKSKEDCEKLVNLIEDAVASKDKFLSLVIGSSICCLSSYGLVKTARKLFQVAKHPEFSKQVRLEHYKVYLEAVSKDSSEESKFVFADEAFETLERLKAQNVQPDAELLVLLRDSCLRLGFANASERFDLMLSEMGFKTNSTQSEGMLKSFLKKLF